jgi:hypothetical protein
VPLPSGAAIELDRKVNASGAVSVGCHLISAGLPLAGQRVTMRPEGRLARLRPKGALNAHDAA